MSELINTNDNHATIRWKLLTGASALVLTASIASAGTALADDSSQLWIDFGGQLERVDGTQQPFAPAFTQSFAADGITPVEASQKPPLYSSGFEGAILFQPEDSKWHFSAAMRYGRSNNSNTTHEQTSNPPSGFIFASIPALSFYNRVAKSATSRRFGDTVARNDERHAILDFQAGRDLGLGLFGGKASADFGVRFAQFSSKSRVQITANSGPDWVLAKYLTTFAGEPAHISLQTEYWDLYHAKAVISRTFHGIGPSLAFKTSVPFAGNQQAGQLALDLGVNGAVLFGRQRTTAHHQTYDARPDRSYTYNFVPLVPVYHHYHDPARSRSVTVPNLGGFAALSFRYVDAKISLGYRADFFSTPSMAASMRANRKIAASMAHTQASVSVLATQRIERGAKWASP